jgi:Secretion system C-terminal sorting domain
MKTRLLIATIFLMACSHVAQAQWATWKTDSINMAPGITNDVFYSLENSTVKTESSNNWVLALSTTLSTAGIWANHSAGVRIFRTGKHISQWNTITLNDTALEQLFNPDTSWDYGALNAKAAAVYDYGWGVYNTVTHNVYGDSIFILAQGNNFYQLVVDSMLGFTNDYYTRVAPVGMPNFTASSTFKKSPKFSNSNFIYVRAGAMGLSDTAREPAKNTWDLLFTKYITQISNGAGGFIPYPVRGVLSNRGTETARIIGVPVEGVSGNYATYPLNTKINNIGYDWKFFNGTFYEYPDSLSYLIKSKAGSLWQIDFTGYSTSTGITKFSKRQLGAPTAINEVKNNALSFGVYPNPTFNTTILTLESKGNAAATLSVIDLQGKTIINKAIQITAGLNAYQIDLQNLQTGNYIITINGASIRASKNVTKQ